MSIYSKEVAKKVQEIKNFKELVEFVSKEYGDNLAYISKNSKKTFNDLENDVKRVAGYIIEEEIQNENIVLLGATSYEYYVVYMAISISGNVVVPLDKSLKAHEIVNLLEMASAKYVYIDSETIDYHKQDLIKKYCTAQLGEMRNLMQLVRDAKSNMNLDDIKISEKETSTIIFTSGTTAVSKGVMLSQYNVISNATNTMERVNYTETETAMTILPINHAYGFTSDLCMTLFGFPLYINDSLENFSSNLKLWKPSIISAVPLVMENIASQVKRGIKEKGKEKLIDKAIKISNFLLKCKIDIRRLIFKSVLKELGTNFKFVQCGGAAISKELVEYFYNFGIEITQGYGISECSPIVALVEKSKILETVGSVGRAIQNTKVKIIEDEICVKGPGVMNGYYNNEEATKEAFTKTGWFRTGDLGYLDKDGNIYITGRLKNLIILDNGKNVYPEELENYLQVLDCIAEVAVYENSKLITAEIYLAEGYKEEDARKAVAEVNTKLATFKRIQKIKFRNREFEKTALKKIKRSCLNKEEGKIEYISPKTELQEILCKEFENVLDREKVGITNNFFELGGDSLSAVQLTMIEIEDIVIEMEDIYNNPTVEKLSKCIESKKHEISVDESINLAISNTKKITQTNKPQNILLTGATGFLGSHILKELLEKDVNVYCLVRSEERFTETLAYYFPNASLKTVNLIIGDITKTKFGLKDSDYNYFAKEIDTVIHVAANVKHAEEYDVMQMSNVQGTINVAKFCEKANAVMHHTSTASLHGSGVTRQTKSDVVFTENNLSIGQQVSDNVYIKTKYEAEEYIITERVKGNLVANIYRIGNLTWRVEDKKFQKNAEDNGFLNRIHGLIKLGKVCEEVLAYPVDFTAVDECAKAYVKLVFAGNMQNIYNLYNPNILSLDQIASLANYKIDLVDKEEFEQALRANIEDKEVTVLSFYYSLGRKSRNIPMSNAYTVEELEKLDFKFSKITREYLEY